MSSHPFSGVLPAITTAFTEAGEVDHGFLAEHVRWLLDAGCRGIIPLGSLGEGATLSFDEKRAILETIVQAAGDHPVMPGIAALSTHEAVALATMAKEVGCRGLMVLPAYVHKGELRESLAHVSTVIDAVDLPCMLYNNPPAYGTDFVPESIAGLAERHTNLVAVKESSGDSRRVTAVRALCGDRLSMLVGLDDMVLEGVAAGAEGWVAGLVNALPRESVALFDTAREQGAEAALPLYSWFLPLLRLDTVPEFVQLIKLTQERFGMGSERVRLPRLPVEGQMREDALSIIEQAMATRPELAS